MHLLLAFPSVPQLLATGATMKNTGICVTVSKATMIILILASDWSKRVWLRLFPPYAQPYECNMVNYMVASYLVLPSVNFKYDK